MRGTDGLRGESRPNRASVVDVAQGGGGVPHDSPFEIQLNSQIWITHAKQTRAAGTYCRYQVSTPECVLRYFQINISHVVNRTSGVVVL